ncbi:MAG TPA: TlpA disulfide reductase family protein [Symbiobacteriaceae bacterium]
MTRRARVALLAPALLTALVAGCGAAPGANGAQSPSAPAAQAPAAQAPEKPSQQPPPSEAPKPSATVKLAVGYKAPAISVTDLGTGQNLTLDKLKGQVVVLNFWATWCGPCKAEMPDLQTFQQENQGKVRVVAVGIEGETPDGMRAFAKNRGLTFTLGYDGGKAQKTYQVFTIPFTYWIDQNGVIQAVTRSAMPLDFMRTTAVRTAELGRGNP